MSDLARPTRWKLFYKMFNHKSTWEQNHYYLANLTLIYVPYHATDISFPYGQVILEHGTTGCCICATFC